MSCSCGLSFLRRRDDALGRQQWIELPLPLKLMQLVRAAHMGRADEDLRHGVAAGRTFDHLPPALRVAAYVVFGERYSLAGEQRLGGKAIGAVASGIDFDLRHWMR